MKKKTTKWYCTKVALGIMVLCFCLVTCNQLAQADSPANWYTLWSDGVMNTDYEYGTTHSVTSIACVGTNKEVSAIGNTITYDLTTDTITLNQYNEPHLSIYKEGCTVKIVNANYVTNESDCLCVDKSFTLQAEPGASLNCKAIGDNTVDSYFGTITLGEGVVRNGTVFSRAALTPSVTPSASPSIVPGTAPSVVPSTSPSVAPSSAPSIAPSSTPQAPTVTNVVPARYEIKATRLVKLSSIKKKQLKVTWKKVKGCSGYYLYYSTKKSFTKKTTKLITIKKDSKVSYVLKKLKSKKKYYIRICAWKKYATTLSQSAMSKTKSCKIK